MPLVDSDDKVFHPLGLANDVFGTAAMAMACSMRNPQMRTQAITDTRVDPRDTWWRI